MGIESLTKLEKNEDGTYTATCSDKCETEIVTKNDLELGLLCKKKYVDRDESFLKVREELFFTNYSDYTRCNSREVEINCRFILRRVSKYHHTLENLKTKYLYDCLLEKSEKIYVFHYFERSNIQHIEIIVNDKGYIEKIRTKNYQSIEGDFTDNALLKLELEKRKILKNQRALIY